MGAAAERRFWVFNDFHDHVDRLYKMKGDEAMAKVFLSGASGRVGKRLVRALADNTNGFELVGGWCLEAGEDLGVLAGIGELGILASADLGKALEDARPDIVIEFSSALVMKQNLECYLSLSLDAVVGTTGLAEAEIARFGCEVKSRGLRWAVIPNYGLGVTLAADFLRRARSYYPFSTVTDHHTNQMANAPSGTAAYLAKTLSQDGRKAPASLETYPGALGADIEGTRVFAERIPWPGEYSGHTVTLAREDEIITINIQDFTSGVYVDGVLMTARKLPLLPAGSFVRSLGEILDG